MPRFTAGAVAGLDDLAPAGATAATLRGVGGTDMTSGTLTGPVANGVARTRRASRIAKTGTKPVGVAGSGAPVDRITRARAGAHGVAGPELANRVAPAVA